MKKDFVIRRSERGLGGFAVFSTKPEDEGCTSESEHVSVVQALHHCGAKDMGVELDESAVVTAFAKIADRIKSMEEEAKFLLQACPKELADKYRSAHYYMLDFTSAVDYAILEHKKGRPNG